ncbi:hypothetical protein EJD97_012362, partial [Solanum chilense]
SSNPNGDMAIKYGLCLKNHATKFCDFSVDRFREFVKKGDEGTKEEFICANCGCFRSFHRVNIQSLFRSPVLRCRFIHPHVILHGGGNASIIFHPNTTRDMSVQYIRRPVFY